VSDLEKDKMGLPANRLHEDEHLDLFAPILEKHLVSKFEALLQRELRQSERSFSLRREVGAGRSIADVVAFLLPHDPSKLYSSKLSASEAVLVSIVREKRTVSVEELQRIFGPDSDKLNGQILRLISNQVINQNESLLSLNDGWPPLKIIAYEAKLREWKEAVEQASTYLAYADESFVVLPSMSSGTAFPNASIFEERGVGLISVDENKYQVLIPSKGVRKHDWRRDFLASRALEV
jgi:hypothetical protein